MKLLAHRLDRLEAATSSLCSFDLDRLSDDELDRLEAICIKIEVEGVRLDDLDDDERTLIDSLPRHD